MKPNATFFAAIGKNDGLEKILFRFYEKMRQDLLIGFFFSNKDVQAIALQQKAFLLRAWGITQSYSGKSPAEAHHDLPKILSGHFDRRLILLEETLKEFKINKENIKLWIEFESKFRKAVVRD